MKLNQAAIRGVNPGIVIAATAKLRQRSPLRIKVDLHRPSHSADGNLGGIYEAIFILGAIVFARRVRIDTNRTERPADRGVFLDNVGKGSGLLPCEQEQYCGT